MKRRDDAAIDRKFQKELNAGIAELVLIAVLGRAEAPVYGYQIAKEIEQGGAGLPGIKLGTLYPVLRSLQKSGLLESNVEPSVTGPPRRYYRITPAGRETLARRVEMWDRVKTFVDTHLKGDQR